MEASQGHPWWFLSCLQTCSLCGNEVSREETQPVGQFHSLWPSSRPEHCVHHCLWAASHQTIVSKFKLKTGSRPGAFQTSSSPVCFIYFTVWIDLISIIPCRNMRKTFCVSCRWAGTSGFYSNSTKILFDEDVWRPRFIASEEELKRWTFPAGLDWMDEDISYQTWSLVRTWKSNITGPLSSNNFLNLFHCVLSQLPL